MRLFAAGRDLPSGAPAFAEAAARQAAAALSADDIGRARELLRLALQALDAGVPLRIVSGPK